jgi:hypothetical protein
MSKSPPVSRRSGVSPVHDLERQAPARVSEGDRSEDLEVSVAAARRLEVRANEVHA